MFVEARTLVPSDDEVEELLVERAPEAHRLATWILRDPVAAEDAVQEAALAAWNGRRRLRHSDNLSAWFTRIVVNVCRDELRRQARHKHVVLAARAADELSDGLSLRDEIGRAIGLLTPEEQLVIGLRFGRDLSVTDIATLTGIAEGTVKSRLHYSLDHLRAALAAERRTEVPRDE